MKDNERDTENEGTQFVRRNSHTGAYADFCRLRFNSVYTVLNSTDVSEDYFSYYLLQVSLLLRLIPRRLRRCSSETSFDS
jgi:hypothetical protein